MKILQVVHGFPPNQRAGTEIYTYYLSKELAKEHEVHVFYPTKDEIKKKSYSLHSFRKEDLHIHELVIPSSLKDRIIGRLFFENTYINKAVEIRFRELLREIKPDIIHFEHLIRLSTSLIDIASKSGIPTVLTLHDFFFLCPNIHLFKYNNTVCDGPEKNKCRECWVKKVSKLQFDLLMLNSAKKFEQRNNYLKFLLSKVDKIIAPSRFLESTYIKYGIPKDKIIYSENGYRLDLFKNFRKKEKNTDKTVFGFAGGVVIHKGIHVLIDAFMKVPEDKAELAIYGGYDAKSKYVRNIMFKIGSKKNIKMLGRYDDVKKPYSEIDVLIFPSICIENSPLVVKEAFITKTPVIASNIGGIPELIKNGVNGLLFEPNNPEDLYDKIMDVIESPSLLEKFKSNIRPPKSIEEQAKEIVEIYIELIR